MVYAHHAPMHTTAQPDPAALAFLRGIDVREIDPELIELHDPDEIADDGGPAIH